MHVVEIMYDKIRPFMLKGYTKSLKKVAGNRRDIYTYYLNV